MSLHYILDGYNVIKHPEFPPLNKLRDQRQALIRFIQDKKPCGSSNNKVTVVFDGKNPTLNFNESGVLAKGQKVGIIFTYGSCADDKIKKLVSSSQNPKRIVVVSDDREIQFFIKSYGARSINVKDFLEKGEDIKKKRFGDSPKVELSYSEAERISRELKRIWLR